MSTEQPYPQLYEEFLTLLARHDPMGLVKIGAPDHEYRPEVKRILPRLEEASSAEDLERIIHEVFVSMFNEELAGSRSHYREAALEAWELSRRFGINESKE